MNPEEISVILYDEMMAKYKNEIPDMIDQKDRNKENMEKFFYDFLETSEKFSKKEGCEILKKINNALQVTWIESGFLAPENCITIRNRFKIVLEKETLLDGRIVYKFKFLG